MAKSENSQREHQLTIAWGPWIYSRILTFDPDGHLYLVYYKANDGTVYSNISESFSSLPCHVW